MSEWNLCTVHNVPWFERLLALKCINIRSSCHIHTHIHTRFGSKAFTGTDITQFITRTNNFRRSKQLHGVHSVWKKNRLERDKKKKNTRRAKSYNTLNYIYLLYIYIYASQCAYDNCILKCYEYTVAKIHFSSLALFSSLFTD